MIKYLSKLNKYLFARACLVNYFPRCKKAIRKKVLQAVSSVKVVKIFTMNVNQIENEVPIEKVFEIDGKRWYLPSTWAEQGEGFRNFKAKPEDIWIMTQPRSGKNNYSYRVYNKNA